MLIEPAVPPVSSLLCGKFSSTAVSIGFLSLRKVFVCLCPGESCRHCWDLISVHSFIDLFALHLGNPENDSGPTIVVTSLSATSLPRIPVNPGTQAMVSVLVVPSSPSVSMHSQLSRWQSYYRSHYYCGYSGCIP